MRSPLSRYRATTGSSSSFQSWALYCYTVAALYEMNRLDRIPLELYLVHRGDWPVPPDRAKVAGTLASWAGREVGPPREYLLTPGRPVPGVDFRAVGRSLEVSVPLPADQAGDGVMLSVDSRFQSHLLDRTAWVLLRTR